MALTEEEKAERARERMLEKAKQYTIGTYCAKFVAKVYQKMIRAEAAAEPNGHTRAVMHGELRNVFRYIGECVCVTCGKVLPWTGSTTGGMDAGHFIASRRNSILFEEANVAPQCARCNRFQGGAPQAFRQWMEAVRGTEEIERLQQLKATVRQFTRGELVDMRIEYTRRLKAAVERIETT